MNLYLYEFNKYDTQFSKSNDFEVVIYFMLINFVFI